MNDEARPPHAITVRVRYADTDQMRMVYHSNYLVYFEMGRTELLRAGGFPYAELEARGVMLPVIEAHCEYRRPARYDDLLTVETRGEPLSPVRIRMHYTIKRAGELLVTGYTDHACMGRDGRPVRLTGDLKKTMERALAGAAP